MQTRGCITEPETSPSWIGTETGGRAARCLQAVISAKEVSKDRQWVRACAKQFRSLLTGTWVSVATRSL